MIENENAENIQPEQVTPAPETPVSQTETAPVESAPKAEIPSISQDEAVKKQNAAFAQMRRAKREAERKAGQTSPVIPPPATPSEQPKPEPIAEPTAPVQTNTEGIEEASEKALLEIAADADVSKITNGLLSIIEMVDNDPMLRKLHDINPRLAFKEAKDMFMARAGVSAAPLVPKSNTPSGGISGGSSNLDALYAEAQKHPAGSREWHKAVDKFNAELKRLG
jgi:hypothetical protein